MPRPDYPPSRIDPIVDTLHGVAVPDPYRWLEDGESDEVRAWTAGQNAATERYLGAVPSRGLIRDRLEQLLTIGALSTPTPAQGRYFYQRRDGRQNQPVLYVRDGVDGADRVLLDPNALSVEGTTALDWFHPSEDGTLLAYGLSDDGSEESVLRVMDVASERILSEAIAGTRACDLAWLPDASAFYYTRYPAAGTVPEGEEQYHRAVYFHELGTDTADDTLVFTPAEKEHWPGVGLSPDGRWLIVTVARTFDQADLYLQDRATNGPLTPVVQDLPFSFDGQVVGDRLYIRTNLDAPNYRLFLTDPAAPARSEWREIVAPRSDAVLDGVMITRTRLVLSYLERATSRLQLAALDGWPRSPAIRSAPAWPGRPGRVDS